MTNMHRNNCNCQHIELIATVTESKSNKQNNTMVTMEDRSVTAMPRNGRSTLK